MRVSKTKGDVKENRVTDREGAKLTNRGTNHGKTLVNRRKEWTARIGSSNKIKKITKDLEYRLFSSNGTPLSDLGIYCLCVNSALTSPYHPPSKRSQDTGSQTQPTGAIPRYAFIGSASALASLTVTLKVQLTVKQQTTLIFKPEFEPPRQADQ